MFNLYMFKGWIYKYQHQKDLVYVSLGIWFWTLKYLVSYQMNIDFKIILILKNFWEMTLTQRIIIIAVIY